LITSKIAQLPTTNQQSMAQSLLDRFGPPQSLVNATDQMSINQRLMFNQLRLDGNYTALKSAIDKLIAKLPIVDRWAARKFLRGIFTFGNNGQISQRQKRYNRDDNIGQTSFGGTGQQEQIGGGDRGFSQSSNGQQQSRGRGNEQSQFGGRSTFGEGGQGFGDGQQSFGQGFNGGSSQQSFGQGFGGSGGSQQQSFGQGGQGFNDQQGFGGESSLGGGNFGQQGNNEQQSFGGSHNHHHGRSRNGSVGTSANSGSFAHGGGGFNGSGNRFGNNSQV
jgi:hypothetical protein